MHLLHVADHDAPTGSRVGGSPPVGVDRVCPTCGGRAEYVLTLGPDVLGPTVDDRALSLLACADIGCRMLGPEGSKSVLVVAHADTPRATERDDGFEGRALVATEAPDAEVTSDDSAVGGSPGYLQSWGYEAGPELEAAGRPPLAQWSEVSYRRDMRCGAYPFLFGTVYLHAAPTPDGRVDLGTAGGFWQNA